MAHTGCIDWPTKSDVFFNTGEGTTHVYAFWLADYPPVESPLSMLRPPGSHPDWFCAGPNVDQVLAATISANEVASPNIVDIFDDALFSKPLLASICLGSASATYATPDRSGYWWADEKKSLTRSGRSLVKDISKVYLRKPIIVTFLDLAPISQVNPGATRGTATVAEAPGHITSPSAA